MGGKVADESEGLYGRKRAHDPDFKGPVLSGRSCTDVLCLLLFATFLLCWLIVAVFAFVNGDPNRLIHPSDSRGEICGRGDFKQVHRSGRALNGRYRLLSRDKDFLLFFDLSKCLGTSTLLNGCPTPQVCVQKCPQTFQTPYRELRGGEEQAGLKKEMQPFCGPEVSAAASALTHSG